MKKSIYEIITGRIVERLHQGEIPWRMPWACDNQFPTNLISKKPYQGVNVLMLAMQRFSSPFWLTFKQAADLGGTVRKGEKSTPVVYWKFLDKETEDGEKSRVPLLRYFSVFNINQVDGLDMSKIPVADMREIVETDTAAAAQAIIDSYEGGPQVDFGYNQACYIPSLDTVQLPERTAFLDDSSFFSTYFHELAHSTARENRINRRPSTAKRDYQSKEYSTEELCAELCACYLMSEASMLMPSAFENSCAYIQSWLKALQNDPKMLLMAASQAQKAASWILGRRGTASEQEGGD